MEKYAVCNIKLTTLFYFCLFYLFILNSPLYVDSSLALTTFTLLSNHHHHLPPDPFLLPKRKRCPHETSFFMCFTPSVSSWFFMTACSDFLFLTSPLVSLRILLHGWRYLPSFSWEDYSPWRSCASPGSPSPLGWQYRLGRGGVRPPFGLFPVSFGEQVGSGVPLTVETWVLNLGLLTP